MRSKKIALKKSWEYYFKKLQKFKKDMGHTNIPFEWEHDVELAYWTEVQRTSKLTVTKVHFKLLNQIGFDWKFEDLTWDAMFKRLNNYYDKHFHVVISPHDKEHDGLRRWLMNQKWSYNTLSKRKQELLEHFINTIATISQRDLVWEERFTQLLEFKKAHGHCRVPQTYKLNPQLGRWLRNQRVRPGQQTPERIKRLTDAGVEFGRWEPTWEEMYQQLKEFKKEFEHTSPGQKTHPVLGGWVIGQRVLNNKKILLNERKELLDKLDFDWKPMQSRWLKQFEGYKKLFVTHKKKIPYQLIKDTNYDNWIYSQRMYFEKNKLSPAQIKLLTSVKIDLHRRPVTAWEGMFEELKQFKKKFGHFQVFKPEIKKEYKKLAAWVDMQRRKKKQGLLSKHHIDLLDSIAFIWNGGAAHIRKGIPRPKKGRGFLK